MGLTFEIENFKSIERLKLELADLTILVGPPAAGKSNILDALALAGYLHRFKVLGSEYGGSAVNLEPLGVIARFRDPRQLFRYYDLTRAITINTSGALSLNYKISYVSGALRVVANDTVIPWDLRTLRPDSMQEVQNAINNAKIGFETRLYGFDRYGLASDFCSQPHPCGFYLRLSDPQLARSTPSNILSELGWNAPFIVKQHPDVARDVNDELREHIDERVELKMLRSGATLVFDYDFELDMVSVSESIFRALYTLLALSSSLSYVILRGLEKKFIAILEEPEAHVFPFFLNLMVEHIREALDYMYVVISTHNPLFVSLLWDRIKGVKTYYVYRNNVGSTRAVELDVKRMAEEMATTDELLLMAPRDVLEKYAVGAVPVEGEQAKSVS